MKGNVNNDSQVSPLSKRWAVHRDRESSEAGLGHFILSTRSLRCLCDIQVEMSNKEQNIGAPGRGLGWLLI